MITSVSYSQGEIVRSICLLYLPNGIEFDMTYRRGGMYKASSIEPEIKSDITNEKGLSFRADCTNLPLQNNTVNSVLFDPPFIPVGKNYCGTGIIHKGYDSFPGMKSLWDFYRDSIRESFRVLKPRGFLIVKTQDVVHYHRNYFSHTYIHNTAAKSGFELIDLFVLLAKNRIIRAGQKKQEHARKFHCYFLVFQKRENRIDHVNGLLKDN